MAEVPTPSEYNLTTPIPVTYVGVSPDTALFQVDGTILAQKLVETGYPNSCMIPLEVSDDLVHLGEYFPAGFIVLGHQTFINTLRSMRNRIHSGLEEIDQNPRRRLFRRVLGMDIRELAYLSQRDRGYLPIIAHTKAQSTATIAIVKDGHTVAEAKDFTDELLERSLPYFVGWVLAHEYEHGNNFGKKNIFQLMTTQIPLIIGISTTFATASSGSEYVRDLALTTLVSAFSAVLLGTREVERASFQAGDEFAADFSQTVTINHEVFEREVLGRVIGS